MLRAYRRFRVRLSAPRIDQTCNLNGLHRCGLEPRKLTGGGVYGSGGDGSGGFGLGYTHCESIKRIVQKGLAWVGVVCTLTGGG
jgi:hypothetical protein